MNVSKNEKLKAIKSGVGVASNVINFRGSVSSANKREITKSVFRYVSRGTVYGGRGGVINIPITV